MRKGIYVPLYETEPDDLAFQIMDAVLSTDKLEGLLNRLRIERNLKLHADSILSAAISSIAEGMIEVHRQIATCGFARPSVNEQGKLTIKSFNHA
jgi:hypothetical protein